jgi:FAD dependent oxidoreductase
MSAQSREILVIGAGIAGLTAARDLAVDGYDVAILEAGVAITQVIGRRWSITGNGLWRRRFLVGGPTLDAGVAAFGTSYNFGAGVRFGGFYELYNQVDFSDDWGMFLTYQFLPWAEVIVDGGKFQFVRVRLLFSYPLETS